MARVYRNTDPGKHDDPWFQEFHVLDQWLLQWLFDHCDLGGYVELDMDHLVRAFKLPPEISLSKGMDKQAYLLKAIDRLTSPRKGFRRIYAVEHPERPDKTLIWCVSHSKIQCNGKMELNAGNPFERRVLLDLSRYSKVFPVGNLYKGFDGLRSPLWKRVGKGTSVSPSVSLSGDARAGEYGGGDKAYDEILKRWDLLPVEFEQYVDIRKTHPVTDAEALLIVHKTLLHLPVQPEFPSPFLMKKFSNFELDKAQGVKSGVSRGKRPSKADVAKGMK